MRCGGGRWEDRCGVMGYYIILDIISIIIAPLLTHYQNQKKLHRPYQTNIVKIITIAIIISHVVVALVVFVFVISISVNWIICFIISVIRKLVRL